MPYNVESVAITGMAGRFPNCSNVEELQQALFHGVDLMSDSHNRWSHESHRTSSRYGIIQDFEYFDAAFFGLNSCEANATVPGLRKLLEVTYEAIVDAGLNPTELRGSKTCVSLALTQTDSHFDLNHKGPITAQCTLPNAVSYHFDFRGPSFAINTACSSAFYALTQAVDNIVFGRCDTAVVAGIQHHFEPEESIELTKIGVLHEEGVSRPFDANRKGYAQSEAVVAIMLQKVENSKRIYATFAGIGTNVEGFKRDGIAHPSNLMQRVMFEDTFKMFNIDPLEVNYVEAHCTGTRVGDVEEVKAIDDFYTKGRKTPLLIGSIKSNLGHSEAASGIVSLIKVLIAIREGVIPGNLNFNSADPEMRGICEGRLKVVDRNVSLPSGLIAINAFGFGGANAIVILRPYNQKKYISNKLSHRLVKVSGSTEDAVQIMLDAIIQNKTNEQFLSLIDNIHKKPIENHNYKGYTILANDSHYEINEASCKKRPVWYIYSGFGSQWPGMGNDLMRFEVFRNTIKKCARALNSYGVDLEAIVKNSNEEILTNIVNTFVGITAISVALTDTLGTLSIKPDGIIGHSIGEIACAYADGLISAEQAVLIAYGESNAVANSELIPSSMASIGLSIEQCEKILPKGVYISCDNSDENVTISGPAVTVKEFLNHLETQGIFNKFINNVIYPLYSPHLAPATQKMYTFVKQILPNVTPRSGKWLPSTLPEIEWNTNLGKFNSAEYHYHNFINRVHFRQLLKYIPKDAIVIEIAPRGLLQAILKKSLDENVTMLSLLKPGVDNVDFFLSNIGKFYINGGQMNLTKLYAPVSFPVSSDTPLIGNLVKWDHGTKWRTLRYNPGSHHGFQIDIDNQSNQYLEGHKFNGRVTLPASGYIFLVWQAYANMLETSYQKLPVVFENFKILNPVLLIQNQITTIVINIFKSTRAFEMCFETDQQLIATGKISTPQEIEKEFLHYPTLPQKSQTMKINHDDFYYDMQLRGYHHSGIFLGVQECDFDNKSAILKWDNNWVAFMDAMVQYILNMETSGCSFPTVIEKMVINPETHFDSIDSNSNIVLKYNQMLKAAKCGGVELRNITVRNAVAPILKKSTFVPKIDREQGMDPFHMGLAPKGALVNFPATVPLAYILSYYGLFVRSKLSRNDSLLIHNFQNPFSLSAIHLAIHKGCIFYVVTDFSELGDVTTLPIMEEMNIIVHSKRKPFYETLMERTNGNGVNVVFNCGSRDLLEISKKLISKRGHMIEINNKENLKEKNLIYHNINTDDIFEEDESTLNIIRNGLAKCLEDGAVVPLEADESKLFSCPRICMDPKKSYVIVGDLGDFNFELARWLIGRGATKIVLASARVTSGYQALSLQNFNNQGVTVVSNTCDATIFEEAQALLNFAANLGPVGGIFNIKEDTILNQASENFNVNTKISVAQNLDTLSRSFCKELDYFVMFPSVGNCFANSAIGRICETRKLEGLPGKAIDWGSLDQVSILDGSDGTNPTSCLEALDYFL